MAETARRLRRRIGPAEVIADELRSRILSGEVPDGDAARSSRSSSRSSAPARPSSARRATSSRREGLVRVRRGNVGGSEVHVPGPANAAYVVGQVLEARRVRTSDVAAAVARFEPLCAELCAERPDRVDAVLPSLEARPGRAGRRPSRPATARARPPPPAGGTRRWSRAAGTRRRVVLLGTLEAVWGTHATAAAAELTARGEPLSAELSRPVHEEHEEIQAAHRRR